MRRRWTRFFSITALTICLTFVFFKTDSIVLPSDNTPWATHLLSHWSQPQDQSVRIPKPGQDYASLNYAPVPNPQTTHVNPPNALIALILAHEPNTFPHWAYEHFATRNVSIHPYCTVCPPLSSSISFNKGHEALPYLYHITSHYDDLADFSVFAHANEFTWHNNDVLDSSTAIAVERLRPGYVAAHGGYANLRCHRNPGCPGNLRPLVDAQQPDKEHPQAAYMARVWRNLFPDDAIPERLSAPCCAQFVVQRETIHRHPKTRYEAMLRWLQTTSLDDEISGRVFEYLWQYLFTGEAEVCPGSEYACYCGMYGACFEDGEAGYEAWVRKREGWREVENELRELVKEGGEEALGTEEGREMVARARVLKEEVVGGRERAWKVGDEFRE